MPINLENSAVATRLEKVSFHSNPKEKQCQRMFILPYSCTHFTCYQGHAQNHPNQASTVHELRISRYTWQTQKRQRNQRSNYQHPLDHKKARVFQKNIYSCFIDYAKAFDCVDHKQLGKFLKRWENTRPPDLPPAKPECRSRSSTENQTRNN